MKTIKRAFNWATRNDPIMNVLRAEKLQKMIVNNPNKPLNDILNDFCKETEVPKHKAIELYEMLVKRKKIEPRNEKIEA